MRRNCPAAWKRWTTRPRAAGVESAREGRAAERPKSSGGHRHSAQRPHPADLWGLLSHQSEKPPEVIAPESVSEAASETASEPVNENVTLTPDLVGRDYDAEVRNNRSYIDEYLFYVTLEYSDTVEKGRIIRQSPEAGEVIQKGDTVSLVVSRGPR